MKSAMRINWKIAGLVFLVSVLSSSLVFGESTDLVSISLEGTSAYGMSTNSSISADGRYVAFSSSAPDLVPDDTNGAWDVFVIDTVTGITERVSVDSGGGEGNSTSTNPSISADGRFVAFESYASNLVPDDMNGTWDVFVRDRLTLSTERVSVNPAGEGGNSQSKNASISGDGRYVVFESFSSNLSGGDVNGTWDVFIHDSQTGIVELISVTQSGQAGMGTSYDPSISVDGKTVSFLSYASNFIPGDTNGTWDIYVYNRELGGMELASIRSDGGQANSKSFNASVSKDGRYVVFVSLATNLVDDDINRVSDVFLRDRISGITERISAYGNGASDFPVVSGDGRYVAFQTKASNLTVGDVNGTTDIVMMDREQGLLELVSVNSDGIQGNSMSAKPSISMNGMRIAFESNSSNLDPHDPNSRTDVFLRDIGPDNAPPVADAGQDQVISCSGIDGTEVVLDGSLSIDPDGDVLSYLWTEPAFGSTTGMMPAVLLPLGTFEFELLVDDGNGGTDSDSVTISVTDSTPPATIATILTGTPASIINEWYKEDVRIELVATDNCAGCETINTVLDGAVSEVKGSTHNILITAEGEHDLVYWSVDGAGNREVEKSVTIKIDKTPPGIMAELDPAPDAEGWNNTDVTVHFICSDALSGMAQCPDPVVVSEEGEGQEISRTALDNAGNTSSVSVLINIDKTAPSISVTADPEYLWPPNGKKRNVNVEVLVMDDSLIRSATIRVEDEYGRTVPPINGLSGTVKLRAWRKQRDRDGRHYTIIAEVIDMAGNVSTAITQVIVPHNRRDHKHDRDRKHKGHYDDHNGKGNDDDHHNKGKKKEDKERKKR